MELKSQLEHQSHLVKQNVEKTEQAQSELMVKSAQFDEQFSVSEFHFCVLKVHSFEFDGLDNE
jgi:hypothetical protein